MSTVAKVLELVCQQVRMTESIFFKSLFLDYLAGRGLYDRKKETFNKKALAQLRKQVEKDDSLVPRLGKMK